MTLLFRNIRWMERYQQTTDEEVRELLERATERDTLNSTEQSVQRT
jgi:predicted phosphoribosyltransferase